MGQAQGQPARSARCIALVGPYLSGKTTLLESILARTGVISRQGTTAAKNTVGDASDEARHHGMSVELNVATVDFLGDSFTFLDCPGSIEFQTDAISGAGTRDEHRRDRPRLDRLDDEARPHVGRRREPADRSLPRHAVKS
jgi:elongation factor G